MVHILTAAIPVAEVGEAPDVAKTDGVAEGGEDELDLPTPFLPHASGRVPHLHGFTILLGKNKTAQSGGTTPATRVFCIYIIFT